MKKAKKGIKLLVSRKVLVFMIFLITLGLVAPVIIFYSLGYRFDPKVGIFIYSGTVVLKPTPFDVNVFVDGEPLAKKQIDIINQSININGLKPGEYEIKVSKDGYQDWIKKTRVRSGIATEFWNVSLAPNNPSPKEVLEKSVAKSAFSSDKSKLAYFSKEEEFLAFYVRDDSGDHMIKKETANERFPLEAGEIKWSNNNNWLIFSFKKGEEEKISLLQTEKLADPLIDLAEILPQTENEISEEVTPKSATEKETKKITSAPLYYTWDDGGDLYVLSEGSILSFRLKDIASLASAKALANINENLNLNSNDNSNINENKNSIQRKTANANLNDNSKLNNLIASTSVADNSDGFAFCGSYICSISANDRKIRIMSLTGNLVKEIDFATEMKSQLKYQIFAYGDKLLAILDGEKRLFLWDETRFKENNVGPITKIGNDVTDIYFSDDGKKLLFKTENEAIVYFVRDWEVQPKHLAGEKEIVYSGKEKIDKIQWFYDYQNIFVSGKKEIILVELDGREGRNMPIFLKNEKEIFDFNYDGGEKKLWFTEGDNKENKKLKEIIFPESGSLFSNIIGN